MSKVVIFSPYTPKFFDDLFLGIPNFLGIPKFFPLIYLIKLLLPIIFYLFRAKNLFLDFIDLKTAFSPKNLFFRPKKNFLDFLDLKISLNPLKTLRKHLFSL